MLMTPAWLLGLFLLPVLSVFSIWLFWLWLLPPSDIPPQTRTVQYRVFSFSSNLSLSGAAFALVDHIAYSSPLLFDPRFQSNK